MVAFSVPIVVFLYRFFCSQCRGINIQLEDITKVAQSEPLKAKYSKRKGFSKAQDEMEWYIRQIKYKTNEKKIQNKLCIVDLRRSARIIEARGKEVRLGSNISSGTRRSARIAQLQKRKN